MNGEILPEEAHYNIITAIQKQKTNDKNYIIPTGRRIANQPIEKQLLYYKNLTQQYEKNIKEKEKLNFALIEEKYRLLSDFELEKQQLNEQNNELENYLRIVEQKNREFYKQQFEKELHYTEELEEEIKERYKDLYEQNKKLVNQNIKNELNKKYHIQAIIQLNKQIGVLKNELKKIKQEKKDLKDKYDNIVKLTEEQAENIKKKNNDIEKKQKLIDDYKKELSFYKARENGYQKELEKQEELREQIILKNQEIYELKRKMNPQYRRFFPNKFVEPISKQLNQNVSRQHLYWFNNPKYEEYMNLNNIAQTANKKYK